MSKKSSKGNNGFCMVINSIQPNVLFLNLIHMPKFISRYEMYMIPQPAGGRGAIVSACADLTNQLQCCWVDPACAWKKTLTQQLYIGYRWTGVGDTTPCTVNWCKKVRGTWLASSYCMGFQNFVVSNKIHHLKKKITRKKN